LPLLKFQPSYVCGPWRYDTDTEMLAPRRNPVGQSVTTTDCCPRDILVPP